MVAHTFIGLCTVIFERGLVNLSSREGGLLSVCISFITPARCVCKQSGGTFSFPGQALGNFTRLD